VVVARTPRDPHPRWATDATPVAIPSVFVLEADSPSPTWPYVSFPEQATFWKLSRRHVKEKPAHKDTGSPMAGARVTGWGVGCLVDR
jgi:hypothetical protein